MKEWEQEHILLKRKMSELQFSEQPRYGDRSTGIKKPIQPEWQTTRIELEKVTKWSDIQAKKRMNSVTSYIERDQSRRRSNSARSAMECGGMHLERSEHWTVELGPTTISKMGDEIPILDSTLTGLTNMVKWLVFFIHQSCTALQHMK